MALKDHKTVLDLVAEIVETRPGASWTAAHLALLVNREGGEQVTGRKLGAWMTGDPRFVRRQIAVSRDPNGNHVHTWTLA